MAHMSEDEMLAMAIAASLSASGPPPPRVVERGEGKRSVARKEATVHGMTIQVRLGDLTKEDADVIVNAANQRLDHCSGLAGAIVREGGRIIQHESDAYFHKNGQLDEGSVMHTTAGTLPCKRVIHAVGPVWRDGKFGETIILQLAIRNILVLTDELGYASVAIPALSTGIFRFPKELCAQIMFNTIKEYAKNNPQTKIKLVRLTNFDETTVQIFEREFHEQFPSEQTASVKDKQEPEGTKSTPEEATNAKDADTGVKETKKGDMLIDVTDDDEDAELKLALQLSMQ
mmetsp:Transcript_10763/g.11825  ORF Transcript_10763/g.11825 Transcript_10763/m.11825 type:complete len:287 (+) Transcript_10763:36-896(+)